MIYSMGSAIFQVIKVQLTILFKSYNLYYKSMSFPTPGDDFLDMLMSGKADEYLDREIQRLRSQIGQKQFQQFAEEYFRNEGQENVYALKKQIKQQPICDKKTVEKVEDKGQSFFVTETYSKKIEQKYLEESSSPEQNQQQVIEQEQGLTELLRQKLPDGKIKITYSNSDYYEGQVENERKNGWGTYFYGNGEKYSGIFVEDEIHGYGRYYFLSGAEYQGDWSSGMKHGIGILKFANGDAYEGSFCKDDFHGNGTYRYSNGDVFQGKWKYGKKQGPGRFDGADGLLRIGNWNDDKFEI